MNDSKPAGGHTPEIDLAEVTRLVDAIEQDLGKVRGKADDLRQLRNEVATLKNVLNSPIQRHHWVRDGLHGMRTAFEDALDTTMAEGIKAGRYVAEIGRILGL
ncbi:MAG: hypothetical protein ACREUW_19200 [Burkholderiales bacterium]